MSVRIEKYDAVWTVIHSRPETRNAMDPDSAVALYEAFQAFDTDDSAHVAVFWGEGGAFCSGWDLKHALRQEWWNSKAEVTRGIEGAARFAGGKGRGGDFGDV